MSFQIQALSPTQFEAYFLMDAAMLAKHKARKMIVAEHPGTPCRVSLADAQAGETVLLINYQHQPADTPYQASHAIFVREGVEQAKPAVNDVPDVLRRRLISIRHFDDTGMMIDADAVPGADLDAAIRRAFETASVSYLHLHYAKPGCFAATARRA